jgi:hypothetical protein
MATVRFHDASPASRARTVESTTSVNRMVASTRAPPARRRVEPGAAGPVDHHQLVVALHPGHVPGREVKYVIGADDELLALVGPYAHPSAEDHPAVVELA